MKQGCFLKALAIENDSKIGDPDRQGGSRALARERALHRGQGQGAARSARPMTWRGLAAGLMALATALLSGCRATTTERLGLPPLRTVERVDLARYMGTWYELASFPTSFQEGCCGTSATYTLEADGVVTVRNTCARGSLEGEVDSAVGRARVLDPATNAKLEVSFFRPFWGDYWIIDLDQDYTLAAVGPPSRDYLWILSRTRQIPEKDLAAITARVAAQGYETQRLRRTLQPGGP